MSGETAMRSFPSARVSQKTQKLCTLSIKIKEYKGKDCKKELLEKILKRLHFPASIKGSLELNLEYI
jgi:hypothetical protein